MSPVLIGDGGHARDIWETLPRYAQLWVQIPHHDELPIGWRDMGPVLLGINDPQIRNQVAAKLDIEDEPWIHPKAWWGIECSWGPGTHINYGVTMTRTTIGAHCTIAPGVTICGDVTIGNRVFIGAGAVIVNLTTIPDDTFIKAGTVWTERG